MKGLRKVHQAVYIENFNSLQPIPTGSQQIQQATFSSAKNFAEIIATAKVIASYFSFYSTKKVSHQ